MSLERLALSRSTLDRAAHLRADPLLLERLAVDPTTQVVPIHAGQAPVVDGDSGPLLLLSAATASPELLAASTRTLFLGVDAESRSFLAASLEQPPELPDKARWAGLREV